jgi:uncharacterized ferritin-like protein (DUF455 family)
LLHAIVHIEFSAINLALDHAARFRGLPQAYYADWIGVAAEEAEHFMLLRDRLQSLGYDYGDFPPMPDCGTWPKKPLTTSSPAWRWYHACSKRAASMPHPHPDETGASGRPPSARVLDIILRDEITHVGLGDRWFRYLCAERGIEPESTYLDLLTRYQAPWPQGKLNESARLAAGFSAGELAALAKKVE